MPEIDLTEAERKLIRKLERDEKRLWINLLVVVLSMVFCLAIVILGFVQRNKVFIYIGLPSLVAEEFALICIRNNSKHFRLIKKLMEDEESTPKP